MVWRWSWLSRRILDLVTMCDAALDIKNDEAERIQTVQDAISIFYKYTIDRLSKEAIVEKKDK
jgi:hypothetical protein